MDPMRDASTGVFRPEAFMAFASLITSQTRQRGAPLSLLVVALDGPHDVASADSESDEGIIPTAARLFAGVVGTGQMVGRRDASSFSILAPDSSKAEALRLGREIEAAIFKHDWSATTTAPVSFSIGVATLLGSGGALPELIESAEAALALAVADGGHCVRAAGAPPLTTAAASRPAPAATPAPPEAGPLSVQRNVNLARLIRACQQGEIEGIAIGTQPGACQICQDAARDVFLPSFVPTLPLTGCTTPGGCRCSFAPPAFDPRRRPPPIPAETYGNLEIPHRYVNAALYGSNPKLSCRVDELAEYLDTFPLLPITVDLGLHKGEVAYFTRPARRIWEQLSEGPARMQGQLFPLRGPLLVWTRMCGKPPAFAEASQPFKDEGTLYFTNWRILFSRRDTLDSVLLADLHAIEYLRDGIACRVGQRSNRLFFMLREPLQAGLCLTRAVRDTASTTWPSSNSEVDELVEFAKSLKSREQGEAGDKTLATFGAGGSRGGGLADLEKWLRARSEGATGAAEGTPPEPALPVTPVVPAPAAPAGNLGEMQRWLQSRARTSPSDEQRERPRATAPSSEPKSNQGDPSAGPITENLAGMQQWLRSRGGASPALPEEPTAPEPPSSEATEQSSSGELQEEGLAELERRRRARTAANSGQPDAPADSSLRLAFGSLGTSHGGLSEMRRRLRAAAEATSNEPPAPAPPGDPRQRADSDGGQP